MNKIVYVTLVIILILSVSSFSLAEFTAVPGISMTEKYNDNIFLRESNREDDFITIISPHIELAYSPNTSLDLGLGGGFNFRSYSKHSELNDTSIRETAYAHFRAQARPLNHVFIDIADYYRRVDIDVRDKVAIDNDFENRTEKNTFMISPYANFPLTATVSSRIGYKLINEWYKDDSGNNSDTHSAFLSFDKKFPFGLNTSIGYTYLEYRPELSNDYDKHEGSALAEYQIASNFRVWGGAGIATLDYPDHSNKETIWNVGSEYYMGGLDGVMLTVTYRELLSGTDTLDYTDTETDLIKEKESITLGFTKRKRFDFILSSDRYLKVTINPYHMEIEELETDRIDKITGVRVRIGKSLTARLTATLRGLWETKKFSPGNLEVDQYSLSSGLEYVLPRNITLTLGYRYSKRNSNLEGDDFYNNIVGLSANVTL